MVRKKLLPLLAVATLIPFLTGFGLFRDDVKLVRYTQKKQHHKIIEMLRPSLDSGRELSYRYLLFLAGAYYEIRDYKRAFAVTEIMQKRLAQGDHNAYGSDLNIYPYVYRGLIYLDQGKPQRAVAEGEKA